MKLPLLTSVSQISESKSGEAVPIPATVTRPSNTSLDELMKENEALKQQLQNLVYRFRDVEVNSVGVVPPTLQDEKHRSEDIVLTEAEKVGGLEFKSSKH